MEKAAHVIPQHVFCSCIYLLGVVLYVLYKLYNCFKSKISFAKAITDTTDSGNVFNIKIHTGSESLAMAQEDVPLRELKSQIPEAKPRRSHRLRNSKSYF